MAREILTTGMVNVDRRNIDNHELLEIREGLWSYEKVISESESINNELQTLNSSLPESIDLGWANDLCIKCIKTHLKL
jgi:hypothetical protein